MAEFLEKTERKLKNISLERNHNKGKLVLKIDFKWNNGKVQRLIEICHF